MRIVQADAIYQETKGLTPYQFIEKVGKTCYKSEDTITEDSAERFVGKLTENKHYAMLEHVHVYFLITDKIASFMSYRDPAQFKYLNMTEVFMNDKRVLYISGSFRAFMEFFDALPYPAEGWIDIEDMLMVSYPLLFKGHNRVLPQGIETPVTASEDKSYIRIFTRDGFIKHISQLNEETEKILATKHLTHTVRFICDRGVSHEFVRHRPASFAQESTRYCNYSKEKFGNEITFIEPFFFTSRPKEGEYFIWASACEDAERAYFKLIKEGATPQEARSVLPNSLKTEIIITATEEEWKHIIALRLTGVTGAPHPQMKEVMIKAHEWLATASNNRLKVVVD